MTARLLRVFLIVELALVLSAVPAGVASPMLHCGTAGED